MADPSPASDAFEHSGAPVEASDIPLQPTVAGPGRALSILVAEDNEINALLTRSLLAKLGHRSAMAASGAEAIERFLAGATPTARPTIWC